MKSFMKKSNDRWWYWFRIESSLTKTWRLNSLKTILSKILENFQNIISLLATNCIQRLAVCSRNLDTSSTYSYLALFDFLNLVLLVHQSLTYFSLPSIPALWTGHKFKKAVKVIALYWDQYPTTWIYLKFAMCRGILGLKPFSFLKSPSKVFILKRG